MDLKKIGFYTLSDARAAQASSTSPLWRCEIILTGRCNFKCPYCRMIGGEDIAMDQAEKTLRLWGEQGLKNVRFSGGEPTLHKGLPALVTLAKDLGVERIALSTNGASSMDLYLDLAERGVTDFSISLDACCAEDGDRMSGGRKGAFPRVVNAILELSKLTYVTVGVVLTPDNAVKAEAIVRFADSLGVSDIRVIPAAQEGEHLPELHFESDILAKYQILRYRITNLGSGCAVRGIPDDGARRCGLVLDDMAVMGDKHYPCIIHLREGGEAIGVVSDTMRSERQAWYEAHDNFADPICKSNCLDVCCDYNAAFERFRCSSPA